MQIGVVVHKSLLSQIMSPVDAERLRGIGDVVFTESELPISIAEACDLLEECDIGIGSWQTPYPSAEMLERCANLRLWEHAAGTVKHMFGPHLLGRDMLIASCKTAIADDVAELTVGEIVIGLRRILPNAAANRIGQAPKPDGIKVLSQSSVGVVGASEVGKRVVQRLVAAGCRVFLYDPFCTPILASGLRTTLSTDLTDMCRNCDAITVHTPNIPACRHILGATQFEAMPDDTILVNTSRGECIDEEALIAELQKGRLFAFLDVSSPEPASPDSPLRRLPNVVYTSHIAGPPSFNIGRQAVDDVARFIAGGLPLYVATADSLDITA